MTEYRECEIPEQNTIVPEEILEVDPTNLFIMHLSYVRLFALCFLL